MSCRRLVSALVVTSLSNGPPNETFHGGEIEMSQELFVGGTSHAFRTSEAKAMTTRSERDEWLEPDGLGGFAWGTASGIRTRRYHALLLAAPRRPRCGARVEVSGVNAVAPALPGTQVGSKGAGGRHGMAV